MKKLILFTLLCIANIAPLSAEQWTDSNGTVWTYGIWNTDEAYIQWVSNCPKHVVVPSAIDGHTVTCIGYQKSTSGAKYGLCDEEIESVELPSTISTIGYGAFYKCASIVSISGLNTCKAILEHAFQDCTSLTNIGNLDACESIGYLAFSGCESLAHIGNLSSLKSIGSNLFSDCSHSLISIGNLSACTSIGTDAFLNFTSLTSVGNLSACTSIGNNAFRGCTSLTSIGDLSACTSIGTYAFSGCKSLTSVSNLSICTSIGDYAFLNCSSLSSIGNLSTCTSIGNNAFKGCTSLTSISDLSAHTSIGTYAFSGCKSLTSVGDLSSWVAIPNGVFQDCTLLTDIGNLSACTSIGTDAFSGCTSLVSVGDLSACTSIGNNAFKGCTSLTSISDLSAHTSIGTYAFSGCKSLTSVGDLSSWVAIPNGVFQDCTLLTDIGNLSACTSIGTYAFSGCKSLTSVGNLSECTSIGGYAFQNCASLTSISDLSACTSIGTFAFYGCTSLASVGNLIACSSIGSTAFAGCNNLFTLTICNSMPPKLGSTFDRTITIKVPEDALEAYRTANVWSEIAMQIIPNNVETDYTGERKVTATAQENGSGLLAALGGVDPAYVTHLEIEGTVNSYDIFLIRNKMPNLHVLDMTNTDIVANAYPYYDSYSTMNNEMQGYEFYEQTKLGDVRLPKSVKNVGPYSFSQCSSLKNIQIPEGVERIDNNAFSHIDRLKSINIPESVTSIADQVFIWCEFLENVHFPKSLVSIGTEAFWGCDIKSLELPDGLQEIGPDAFCWNSKLKEVILPGSIKSVGDNAFGKCSALKSVKSKLVDPFTIGQNTFSTWTTATLYVPMTDEWNATFNRYYWDTQWGQFAHIEGWNPTINDFYIDSDYDLDGGTIGGEDNKPDADMNHRSGFHVKDHGHQKFHHVHIKHNGSTSGSMIGDESNLKADRIFSDIEVLANRWYFFSFPFNIRIADIKVPGNRVFRYYDGKERALNARGGWKNLPNEQEYLEAGVGYIFQTNKAGTLTIPVDNPDFATDNKQPILEAHASNNIQDASWNFVGNPYLSYYMLEDLDFSAPITIWNGSSYEAVRPGDDDYLIQPYQAFFVQKPSVADMITAGFDPDKRTTYTKGINRQSSAKAMRAKSAVRGDRQLINISITDGVNSDKTRVVFNDACHMGYEAECDAAKFVSTENVPQIYSVNNNVQYAINERPNGSREVSLGISVKSDGTFTIAAMRMDTPMLLKDVETGITTNLRENSYTFDAKAGTYNSRFMLVNGSETTDVKNVENLTVEDVTYYDLSGKRVNKAHRGVKIANGKKTL